MNTTENMRKLNSIVVGDDVSIVDRLRSILADFEAETSVCFALNAKEAMAIADVIPPDVVIMDINLPGKNVIDLIKDLKSAHSKTKVIMLSNLTDDLIRKRHKDNGADFSFDKTTEFHNVPGAIFSSMENVSD
jgi:DNA-binding response OmpR family regulator